MRRASDYERCSTTPAVVRASATAPRTVEALPTVGRRQCSTSRRSCASRRTRRSAVASRRRARRAAAASPRVPAVTATNRYTSLAQHLTCMLTLRVNDLKFRRFHAQAAHPEEPRSAPPASACIPAHKVDLTLRPARAGHRHRVPPRRPARSPSRSRPTRMHVGDTRLSSCLERDGVQRLHGRAPDVGASRAWASTTPTSISTAPEVPIMDGSAGPFVFLLQSAGIEEQDARKRFMRIMKPVEVRDGDKWARFEPYDGFKLDFTHRLRPSGLRASRAQRSSSISPSTSYVKEVRARAPSASCRTSRRCAPGLALGGSLENAVVLDEYRVLNTDGLRYDDEFVKHKVLDAIGDLYLLGHPLIGAFSGAQVRPRAEQRAAARACWRDRLLGVVSFERAEDAPAFLTWQPQPGRRSTRLTAAPRVLSQAGRRPRADAITARSRLSPYRNRRFLAIARPVVQYAVDLRCWYSCALRRAPGAGDLSACSGRSTRRRATSGPARLERRGWQRIASAEILMLHGSNASDFGLADSLRS